MAKITAKAIDNTMKAKKYRYHDEFVNDKDGAGWIIDHESGIVAVGIYCEKKAFAVLFADGHQPYIREIRPAGSVHKPPKGWDDDIIGAAHGVLDAQRAQREEDNSIHEQTIRDYFDWIGDTFLENPDGWTTELDDFVLSGFISGKLRHVSFHPAGELDSSTPFVVFTVSGKKVSSISNVTERLKKEILELHGIKYEPPKPQVLKAKAKAPAKPKATKQKKATAKNDTRKNPRDMVRDEGRANEKRWCEIRGGCWIRHEICDKNQKDDPSLCIKNRCIFCDGPPEAEVVEKDDGTFENVIPEGYNEQAGYNGEQELLPAKSYNNKVECEKCGAIRWVKKQDLFQVKFCKPCVTIARKERRNAKRKAKRKAAKK